MAAEVAAPWFVPVAVAAIAAVPGVVGAWVSLRVHKEVQSPNGTRTGELVYKVGQDVGAVKDKLDEVDDRLVVVEERVGI
jgi:hypothetical protein